MFIIKGIVLSISLIKFKEIQFYLPCLWYIICPIIGILGSLFINYFCIVERNFCLLDRTGIVIDTIPY